MNYPELYLQINFVPRINP